MLYFLIHVKTVHQRSKLKIAIASVAIMILTAVVRDIQLVTNGWHILKSVNILLANWFAKHFHVTLSAKETQ